MTSHLSRMVLGEFYVHLLGLDPKISEADPKSFGKGWGVACNLYRRVGSNPCFRNIEFNFFTIDLNKLRSK